MNYPHSCKWLLGLLLAIGLIAAQAARADDVFNSNFANGSFDTLGWRTPTGPPAHWVIYDYQKDHPELKISPGPVAKYGATAKDDKNTELLIRKFPALANPTSLTLTFDAGWGWGAPGQGSDSLAVMLLDDDGNGYDFEVHRTKATWAAQWAKVTKYVPAKTNWSPAEIDASQPSVMDNGSLQTFTITRDANGAWQFSGAKWTGATPFAFTEPAISTSTFSQVVLVGSPNFDDILFNHVHLEATTTP